MGLSVVVLFVFSNENNRRVLISNLKEKKLF